MGLRLRQFNKSIKVILILVILMMMIMNMQNKIYTIQFSHNPTADSQPKKSLNS